MGPGWREPSGGSLYFQLKRSALNFSRYHEVSPRTTMGELLSELERKTCLRKGHGDILGQRMVHTRFFVRMGTQNWTMNSTLNSSCGNR